jgi:integrase/recombinase XerD
MGTVAGEGLDVLSEEHPAVALVAGFLDSLQSDRTRAAYLNDLRDFDRWCASKAIGLLDAKRPQIDAYARNLERMGRARSTVSRRLATISGFFRYLEEEGAITLSPATFVRRPFVDRSVRSLGLEREEAARLLEAAAVASPRDHALVCLLLLNGLRVTEACLANVGDLGFERGHTTLALLRRGGVGEVVPLADRTVRALTAHLDGRRRAARSRPGRGRAGGSPAGPARRHPRGAAAGQPGGDHQAGHPADAAGDDDHPLPGRRGHPARRSGVGRARRPGDHAPLRPAHDPDGPARHLPADRVPGASGGSNPATTG